MFEESIELAAKMHYEKGKNLSFNNLKEDNRKAAKHFKWAYEYIPNYLDARQKYIDLKDLAVLEWDLPHLNREKILIKWEILS